MVLGRWWGVPGFLQTWQSCFHQFNLGPETLVSYSPLGAFLQLQAGFHVFCFFATPSRLSCVFHWGEASAWTVCHKAQISGVLQWWLSFWKFLPSLHRISGEWFLVSSLTKALLPQLLSLARQPALGRVLVVPNFFYLRIIEATVLLGTSVQQNLFCTLPQICALTQSSFWRQFFNLISWLVLWYELSAMRP